MRKFIVIVVSLLVPFGLWTAGCRQERDTAFPNSPEMKNLARAAETRSPTRPPIIPAAPIDRDILNLPENNTMARLDAVNDRSNLMAGPGVNPGLFVLPEEGGGQLAALPDTPPTWEPYEDRSAVAMTPIPSAREFWSRPAAPLANRPTAMPSDISAMMPPAPADYYRAPEPASAMLPAPYSPAPTASYGAPYQMPAAMPPGMPYEAPAASPMLPGDIPGVYMDTGEYHGGAGTEAQSHSGWIGMSTNGGDALGAPPSLSSAAFDSVPADRVGDLLRQEPEAPAGPFKLDLDGLLGSMRTIGDAVIPARETAVATAAQESAWAGEWNAVDKWSSAMPVPAAKSDQPFIASPRSLASMDELRDALAPLPDITAAMHLETRRDDLRAAPVTMPPPVPDAAGRDAMEAAKIALLDYRPETAQPASDAKRQSNHDFFRQDFWEGKPASQSINFDDLELKPIPIPEKSTLRRPEPVRESGTADLLGKDTPAEKAPDLHMRVDDAPQKVKLLPMRKSKLQATSHIDAAVEAPPLK